VTSAAEECEPEESRLEGEVDGRAAPADPDAMDIKDTEMNRSNRATASAEG